jgi:hypothetical protein
MRPHVCPTVRSRSVRRSISVLVIIAGAMACMPPQPPPPPTVVPPVEVAASFGTTWDAVIDHFAENNISIRTMDRSSGFIAAEPTRVGYQSPGSAQLAHCGTNTLGEVIPPTDATYNIVVRGDSTRSTVRATVRFTYFTAPSRYTAGGTMECSSTGYWERIVVERIAARAEKRPERAVEVRALATGEVVLTDSSGVSWTVREIPPPYRTAASRLEFTSSSGEVRQIIGPPRDWRTLPKEGLLQSLAAAKVIKKP